MKRSDLEKRAASLGVKPETLRMRMYREELRERAKTYKEPELESFGLRLTASFASDIRTLRKRLALAASKVGAARIELERVLRSKLPAPISQLSTIEGLCLSLEARIAEAMPRSLCPYCKGLDRIQNDCKSCMGTGLASVAQYDKAPARLKKEPYVVVEDGRELPVDGLATEPQRDPFGS